MADESLPAGIFIIYLRAMQYKKMPAPSSLSPNFCVLSVPGHVAIHTDRPKSTEDCRLEYFSPPPPLARAITRSLMFELLGDESCVPLARFAIAKRLPRIPQDLDEIFVQWLSSVLEEC